MKLFKWIVSGHALYILVTAVWSLVDIKSFMVVTGPKTDIWLVKTVGALLIPISLTMFLHLRTGADKSPLFVLGTTVALVFIFIDVYYASKDIISDVYLADAVVESIFLAGWLCLIVTKK